MSWSRRSFLTAGAAAGAMAVLGSRSAHASVATGETPRPVLEIFLQGGLSHEETLWLRNGAPPAWAGEWDASDIGLTTSHTVPVAGGMHLGSMFGSLRGGPNLRLVSLSHTLQPHPVAVPLALTGGCFGRPTTSGMGAAVARLHREQGSAVRMPSFVVAPSNGRATATEALQVGQHGYEYQPVALEVSASGSDFVSSLLAGRSSASDAYRNHLRTRYSDMLTHPALPSAPIRARAFDAYDSAAMRSVDAREIAYMLNDDRSLLQAPSQTSYRNNATTTAIRAASALFANGASYVCVVDPGVEEDYDVHERPGVTKTQLATVQAGNVYSVIQALSDNGLLNDPDLLIVINTEFGRYNRFADQDMDEAIAHGGTDHDPAAYVALLIGGSCNSHGLVGDWSNGSVYTPADMRAALYLHAGIDPLHAECLVPGDLSAPFQQASDPIQTIRNTFFG